MDQCQTLDGKIRDSMVAVYQGYLSGLVSNKERASRLDSKARDILDFLIVPDVHDLVGLVAFDEEASMVRVVEDVV